MSSNAYPRDGLLSIWSRVLIRAESDYFTLYEDHSIHNVLCLVVNEHEKFYNGPHSERNMKPQGMQDKLLRFYLSRMIACLAL